MASGEGFGEAASNLSHSLGRLLDTAAAFSRRRFEELSASVEAERRYRKRQLFASAALILLLLLALLFAGLAVVTAFWDTHPVMAASWVAAGYFALAAAAGCVLWAGRRRRPSTLDWLAQIVALFAEYQRPRR